MTLRLKDMLRQKAYRTRTHLKHLSSANRVCPHTNIYHCTTQKTASQWIRQIFRAAYAYTGLDEYAFSELPETIQDVRIEKSFPKWMFVSQLYIDYETYRLMPKPGSYRTFYIVRDPRDIVISWYFSVRYSHKPIGEIPIHRAKLAELSQSEGIIYAVQHLEEYGLFKAQRSWLERCADPHVKIFRYEALAQDEAAFLTQMFQHCNVPIPPSDIQALVRQYGFEAVTGREHGQEDQQNHLRKGISGDWKNYFDAECERAFARITGDLIAVLGYGAD